MNSTFIQRAAAIGVAGTLLLGAVTQGTAAPVPGSTASLRTAASDHVTDVRWRGRRGGGVAAGVATGLIIGGLAAAAASPRYYGPGPGYYYYEEPVYAAPPVYYDAPPAYYSGPSDPNGPTRRCWVATDKDRGFGYWRAC